MMSENPYVQVPGKISDVFGKIQTCGVPSKFTIEFLNSLGFTSSNDERLIPLMKSLGFLESSGVPTQRFKDYRDKSQAPKIMGIAIKKRTEDCMRHIQMRKTRGLML